MSTCGCKGVRFCALCEDSDRVKKFRAAVEEQNARLASYNFYVYKNGLCYSAPNVNLHSSVEQIRHATDVADVPATSFSLNGISLLQDFLTESEESEIVRQIDTKEWVLSQSGRRKQDYGPKVDFKHKKVRAQFFEGIPTYADLVLDRLRKVDEGKFGHYQPFELCNLEYEGERNSAIEMHKDDMWIWGNRLISLNLLDGTVMAFSNDDLNTMVLLHMPRRALLCFSDESRYVWKHGIFPWHIHGRRIALTMREPAQDFQAGGELYEKYGKELIERGNRRIPTIV